MQKIDIKINTFLKKSPISPGLSCTRDLAIQIPTNRCTLQRTATHCNTLRCAVAVGRFFVGSSGSPTCRALLVSGNVVTRCFTL
mmetsp:Transcript_61105/g.89637  ORF Transcript_61105/g.89637 Transcript_61105/m.89637 type:complete len:84 (+) Transcript_61105:163-414(+)